MKKDNFFSQIKTNIMFGCSWGRAQQGKVEGKRKRKGKERDIKIDFDSLNKLESPTTFCLWSFT